MALRSADRREEVVADGVADDDEWAPSECPDEIATAAVDQVKAKSIKRDISFALRRGTIGQVTTHHALDVYAWLRPPSAPPIRSSSLLPSTDRGGVEIAKQLLLTMLISFSLPRPLSLSRPLRPSLGGARGLFSAPRVCKLISIVRRDCLAIPARLPVALLLRAGRSSSSSADERALGGRSRRGHDEWSFLPIVPRRSATGCPS
jgi:hypothetical protein